MIPARDEPSRLLSSSGVYRFDGGSYSLSTGLVSGGRNWAAIQPPAPKRMTRPCASPYTLLLGAVSQWGNAGSRLWGEPWTPRAEPTWPPPRPFFVDRSYATLWLASATAAGPLAWLRSRCSAPTVDGVARWPDIQRSELLPSRDALRGLSKPCTKDTPFVAGVAIRDGSPTLGVGVHSAYQATRDRWFPESGLCSHRLRSNGGLWIRFLPRVSAGVSMDAN